MLHLPQNSPRSLVASILLVLYIGKFYWWRFGLFMPPQLTFGKHYIIPLSNHLCNLSIKLSFQIQVLYLKKKNSVKLNKEKQNSWYAKGGIHYQSNLRITHNYALSFIVTSFIVFVTVFCLYCILQWLMCFTYFFYLLYLECIVPLQRSVSTQFSL